MSRSDRIARRSRHLISQSARLHAERAASPFPRFFVVHGEVDGRPVRASWFCGTLTASPSLAQRAQLLVDLGEHFEADERGPAVMADLAVPTPALLTCVRACDRVRVVRFGPVATTPPQAIPVS